MNRLARKRSRRARTTKLVFELLEPRLVLAAPAISGADTIDEGGIYWLHLEARAPDTTGAWTIDWGDGSDPDSDSVVGEIVNGNPSRIAHVYPDGPGSYNVSAVVMDADGSHVADAQVRTAPVRVTLPPNPIELTTTKWSGNVQMTTLDAHVYIMQNGALHKVDPDNGNVVTAFTNNCTNSAWSESTDRPLRITSGHDPQGQPWIYVIQDATLYRVDPATGDCTSDPRGTQWTGANLEVAAIGPHVFIIQNGSLHKLQFETAQLWRDPRDTQFTGPIKMTASDSYLYVIQNEILHRVHFDTADLFDVTPVQRWRGNVSMTTLPGFIYVIEGNRLYEIDAASGDISVMAQTSWENHKSMTALSDEPGRLFIVHGGGTPLGPRLDGFYANYGDTIQRAVDEIPDGAPSAWNEIVIPAGDYYVGGGLSELPQPDSETPPSVSRRGVLIENKRFLNIEGAGVGSTVLHFRYGETGVQNGVAVGDDIHGLEISNMTLVGNSPTAIPANENASPCFLAKWPHRAIGTERGVAEANGCLTSQHHPKRITSVRLHDLHILAFGTGIQMASNIEKRSQFSEMEWLDDIIIENNVIDNSGPFRVGGGFGYGIHAFDLGGQLVIRENRIDNSARHSVYHGGGDGQTLIIGNMISNNGGQQVALTVARSNNVTVAFNTLFNNRGINISVEDGEQDRWDAPPKNVSVIGNKVYRGNGTAGQHLWFYHDFTTDAYWADDRNITVLGNTCLSILTGGDCGVEPILAQGSAITTQLSGTLNNPPASVSSEVWQDGLQAVAPVIAKGPVVWDPVRQRFSYQDLGIVLLQNGTLHFVGNPRWYEQHPDEWSFVASDASWSDRKTASIAASPSVVYVIDDGILQRVAFSDFGNPQTHRYEDGSAVNWANMQGLSVVPDEADTSVFVLQNGVLHEISDSSFVGFQRRDPSASACEAIDEVGDYLYAWCNGEGVRSRANDGLADPATLGHWSFDVDFTDSSGNGNDLSNPQPGTVSIVPGKFGNAASFAGDGFLFSNAPNLVADRSRFSLGAWIRPIGDNGPDAVILGNLFPDYRAGLTDHFGTVYGYVNDGSTNVNSSGIINIHDGQWHHVAQTFDGSQLKLYIDGELVATKSSLGVSSSGAAREFSIGGRSILDNTYTGLIDEAFFTSNVLTSSDIAAIAFDPADSAILVEVHNVPPVLADMAVTSPIDENEVATLSGIVEDPGALDSFTLDVNWGASLWPDNKQSFSFGNTGLSKDTHGVDWDPVTRRFSVDHQYLDDRPDGYVATVSVVDDDMRVENLLAGPPTLGYWSFDVDFTDSSGNGNDLSTPQPGAVSIVPGKFGNAASFTGDGFLFSNALNLVADRSRFSLGAWIKPSGENGPDAVILGNLFPGYHAGLTDHFGTVFGYVDDGSNAVNSAEIVNVHDGQWHHVAQTFDGSQMKLYIDGELIHAVSVIYLSKGIAQEFSVGGRSILDSTYTGLIDEAFFTSEVLTESRIALHASAPVVQDISVDNVAPVATLSNDGPVEEGDTTTVAFAGQIDPSTVDTGAGFAYSYDFDNDGTFEITRSGLAFATVPDSFLIPRPGSRTVRGRIEDKDGGFTDLTTTIAINHDGDGVFNDVDQHPTTFSDGFSDAPLGGATGGIITDRGSQTLRIQDATNAGDGVLITTDLAGGAVPATVSVCGGAASFSLKAGIQMIVTCGSIAIQVVSGPVQATFFADDGTVATSDLNEGNGVVFEPTTTTFAAPSTNADTVVIQLDGAPFPIDPGESVLAAPFPWQNLDDRFDANNDQHVAPIDVLVIINLLNDSFNTLLNGSKLPRTRPVNSVLPYYDVNGDGFVAPVDVLNVINQLNDPFRSVNSEAPSATNAAFTGDDMLQGSRERVNLISIDGTPLDTAAPRNEIPQADELDFERQAVDVDTRYDRERLSKTSLRASNGDAVLVDEALTDYLAERHTEFWEAD